MLKYFKVGALKSLPGAKSQYVGHGRKLHSDYPQSVEELEDIQSTRQQVPARSFSAALGAIPEAPALTAPGSSPTNDQPAADADFDDGVDPVTGEVA